MNKKQEINEINFQQKKLTQLASTSLAITGLVMAIMLVHGITIERNEIEKMEIASIKSERTNFNVTFVSIQDTTRTIV